MCAARSITGASTREHCVSSLKAYSGMLNTGFIRIPRQSKPDRNCAQRGHRDGCKSFRPRHRPIRKGHPGLLSRAQFGDQPDQRGCRSEELRNHRARIRLHLECQCVLGTDRREDRQKSPLALRARQPRQTRLSSILDHHGWVARKSSPLQLPNAKQGFLYTRFLYTREYPRNPGLSSARCGDISGR